MRVPERADMLTQSGGRGWGRQQTGNEKRKKNQPNVKESAGSMRWGDWGGISGNLRQSQEKRPGDGRAEESGRRGACVQ